MSEEQVAHSTLPRHLLLIAGSGRILAQSAARAGIHPVVLDLYADQDTRECAERCTLLAPARIGFDPEVLLLLANGLAPPKLYPLIYGSGLDITPDLLEKVAENRILYGNPPALLRCLKTARTFYALLDKLDIPYPEIRRAPPSDPAHWLLKAGHSEGGKGVRACTAESRAGENEYFQRRMPGPPMSLLFLADGARMYPIGFNTLWSVERPGLPFLFQGAVNRVELAEPSRAELRKYALKLVQALQLKGLHSLDFMADADNCRVLELNPRPSSTIALYDQDLPGGLLGWHIRSFQGKLDNFRPPVSPIRAFRAVFSNRSLTIPTHMTWPEWCADRPEAGFSLAAGHPFCTITAEGTGLLQIEHLLHRRAEELRRSFEALHTLT